MNPTTTATTAVRISVKGVELPELTVEEAEALIQAVQAALPAKPPVFYREPPSRTELQEIMRRGSPPPPPAIAPIWGVPNKPGFPYPDITCQTRIAPDTTAR